MSHSSRLSIPLLLIIFVALLVPITARAYVCPDGSTATVAAKCPRPTSTPIPATAAAPTSSDSCYFKNVLLDWSFFTEYRCRSVLDSAPAPSSATPRPTSLTVNLCTTEASNSSQGYNSYTYNSCIQRYTARLSDDRNYFVPETVGVTQSSVSSQASGLSITPSSSKEPTDNWDLQGVREPLDNWDLQGGVKTKVVPATRALTPLEKYQAQFNVDAEFNRIATSCGNDDLGMGQERCMNYMI